MIRYNARYRGKPRLRKYAFLSLEELEAFCQMMGIAEEEIEIYVVPPAPAPATEQVAPATGPNAEVVDRGIPPAGPFGVWLNWPGMYVTGNRGQPIAFDTQAAAMDWLEEEAYDLSAVTVRPLPKES